jgi:hypothetical protein
MAKEPVRLPNIQNGNSNSNGYNNNTSSDYNGQRLPQLKDRRDPNNQTSMSENSKRILRWHLWWDKTNSDLRIPTFSKPNKNVDPKIGSLQNVTYKPSMIHILFTFLKIKFFKCFSF